MWRKSRSLEERFKLQEAYDAGPVLGLNRKIIGPSIKNNLVKIPPGLYGQPTAGTTSANYVLKLLVLPGVFIFTSIYPEYGS
jgi:hypothetical protein